MRNSVTLASSSASCMGITVLAGQTNSFDF